MEVIVNPSTSLQRILFIAALILLAASPARAAEFYDVSTLRPAPGGDGLVGVEGARVPNVHDQVLDVKLWGIGDHAPLSLGNEQLYNRVRGVLSVQAKVTPGLAFAVQLPLVVNQHGGLSGGFGPSGKPSGGIGDLRIIPRLGVLEQARAGINLALQGSFIVPIATASLAGQDSPGLEGLLAVSRYWGEAQGGHFELIGNALVGNRDSRTVAGTALGGVYVGARLGAAYYLGEQLLRRVFAELEGRSFTNDFGGTPGTPVETRAGLTLCFGRFIALDLAGGARLTSAVGAPDWHVVGGLGYSPTSCRTTVPPPPGPTAAELAAKAQEEAAAKKAADEAAALKAAEERAAQEKASREQAAAEAARKAAAEAARKAAEEAARKAAEEAARKDSDGDGVPDRIDNCPAEKGPASNYGCPESKKQKVAVREGRIEILDKVQFAAGKATIAKASFGLLDQVAAVLKAHPELAKVEVQGHTDTVGKADKNLTLSQQRAQAVADYLTRKGVAKDVLVAKGYGGTQPVADNKTKAGQEKNRRVEFKVMETKKAPAN